MVNVFFFSLQKNQHRREREREKACFIPFCMTFFLNHFFLFGHSILSCFFFPFLFLYITSIVFSQSNAFIHDFLYDFCLWLLVYVFSSYVLNHFSFYVCAYLLVSYLVRVILIDVFFIFGGKSKDVAESKYHWRDWWLQRDLEIGCENNKYLE